MVTFVAARHRDSLLPALRTSTVEATELLWCVAFVSVAGVHLVAKELKQVPGRKRLLATGVFGGDASRAALTQAADLGVDVRVLNLGGGRDEDGGVLPPGLTRVAAGVNLLPSR